jgi:hypothetical protein
MAWGMGQWSEVRSYEAEFRSQEPGASSQESGFRSQKIEVRRQKTKKRQVIGESDCLAGRLGSLFAGAVSGRDESEFERHGFDPI